MFFADRVVARVDVIAERDQVDGGSISVDPAFGLWSIDGPSRSASTESSTLIHRTWWYTISCLTLECLPKGTALQGFRLPAVLVTARTPQGEAVKIREAWPLLDVSGRYAAPRNTHVSPIFRIARDLPAASYRVRPGLLGLVLDVAGVALIALALGCTGFFLVVRPALRRRTDEPTPAGLARALALVRASQSRTGPDRRRAVGLLARSLPSGSAGLSAAASRAAWSLPEPTPSSVEELALTVEQEVHGIDETGSPG